VHPIASMRSGGSVVMITSAERARARKTSRPGASSASEGTKRPVARLGEKGARPHQDPLGRHEAERIATGRFHLDRLGAELRQDRGGHHPPEVAGQNSGPGSLERLGLPRRGRRFRRCPHPPRVTAHGGFPSEAGRRGMSGPVPSLLPGERLHLPGGHPSRSPKTRSFATPRFSRSTWTSRALRQLGRGRTRHAARRGDRRPNSRSAGRSAGRGTALPSTHRRRGEPGVLRDADDLGRPSWRRKTHHAFRGGDPCLVRSVAPSVARGDHSSRPAGDRDNPSRQR